MNRITIFHYHLQPGGVTNVIQLGAKALINHFPDLKHLRLVCGRQDNTEVIMKDIRKEIDAVGLIADDLKFEICIEPQIDYQETDSELDADTIGKFAGKLLGDYGDSFWWIHNYQLGKNPLFTAAILKTAEMHPEQKMFLQIHDFPECARYDNLEKLLAAGVRNPYPQTASIAYGLINGRDTGILREAGINRNSIFLLNNPVENETEGDEPTQTDAAGITREKFYSHFRSEFPGIREDGKILFYPVRTIRRKNALEAGLIAAISEVPVNLVLSLPGVSDSEKEYSGVCENCFRKGLIPGIWGSGTVKHKDVPSYRIMLQLCDLILSTSVQEGFGYLFINSVRLGVPLVARDLDILDGIRDVFHDDHSYFYKSLTVPLEKNEAGLIRDAYEKKTDKLKPYISAGAVKKLKDRTSALGSDSRIDFSYLSVEKQVEILERLNESDNYKKELHSLNSDIMNTIYTQLEKGRYSSSTEMERFSLKAHAETIEKIIGILYGENREYNDNYQAKKPSVQQNLLDRFAEPEYMRLIYDF